jgi:hypothetical protein
MTVAYMAAKLNPPTHQLDFPPQTQTELQSKPHTFTPY